jgi:uncharacterized membrane protein YfcA
MCFKKKKSSSRFVMRVTSGCRVLRRALWSSSSSPHKISVPACMATGTLAGSLGAMIGVGGGVISSPILRVLGMEGKHASASCLPMVLFSSGVGALSWHLNTPIGVGPDVYGALVIGGTAMLFSPLGVKLSVVLPGKVVGRAMGVLMTIMGSFVSYTIFAEKGRKQFHL